MKRYIDKLKKDFKKSIPGNWTCVEEKNLCDFIVFTGEKLFLVCLETSPRTKFAKPSRLEPLRKYNPKLETYPCFVLNFKTAKKTYLMHLEDVQEVLLNNKYLTLRKCSEEGILIPQENKLTSCKYDLTVFENLEGV